MSDFVDEKLREMQARMKELRPLVDEYAHLETAVTALQGIGSPAARDGATQERAPRRATTTPRRRGAGQAAAGHRGRPKGTGLRAKQALELVGARPGITIPEIAAEMGIKQNYLYRVLPGLQQDGLVRKEGKGWHPVAAA